MFPLSIVFRACYSGTILHTNYSSLEYIKPASVGVSSDSFFDIFRRRTHHASYHLSPVGTMIIVGSSITTPINHYSRD